MRYEWGSSHTQLQELACDLVRPIPLALEIDSGWAPVPGRAVSIHSRTFGGVSHRTVFFMLDGQRV